MLKLALQVLRYFSTASIAAAPVQLRASRSSASADSSVPSDVALTEADRITVRSTGVSVLSPSRFSPAIGLIIGIVGLAVVSAVLLFAGKRTADPRTFPVNEVEVAGTLDYTDRDSLRERVISHSNIGFYSLDLDAIRTDIKRMPWIAEAHIRRISPDRLSIEAFEHEPAARWNNDALISKRFELYTPPQLASDNVQRAEWSMYFSQFPQLRGAAGRHETVLAAFRRYQSVLDNAGHPVQIAGLLEDDRHSQTLVLENEVSVRLGATDQDTRMSRFAEVYQLLVPDFSGQAVKFDMRYRNGFAVTQPGSPRAISNIEAAAQSARAVDTPPQQEVVPEQSVESEENI